MNDQLFTINDFFDVASPYFNGALSFRTPPSAEAAFSSISPVGVPFGDINGQAPEITGRFFGINSVITTDFETAARFSSLVAGTGSATFNTNGLVLATGATSGSNANVTWQPNPVNIFRGSPVFSTTIVLSGGTVLTGFAGLANYTGAFSATAAHIGFKVIGSSLYATQADGSTESSALLDTVGSGDVYNLVLKVNGTLSVDYYFRKFYNDSNGTYSEIWSKPVTIQTNMPTTIVSKASFMVQNDANSSDLKITVSGATFAV